MKYHFLYHIFINENYGIFFYWAYDTPFFYFYTACLIVDYERFRCENFFNKLGSDLVFRLSTLSIWVDANPKSVR